MKILQINTNNFERYIKPLKKTVSLPVGLVLRDINPFYAKKRKPFRSNNNVRLFVASEPCLHDKILICFSSIVC